MSYILDALRRADADRARGVVPGLDAQPLGALHVVAGSRRRWGWRLALSVVGLVLCALAAGVFWRAEPAPMQSVSVAPARETSPVPLDGVAKLPLERAVPPPLLVQPDTRTAASSPVAELVAGSTGAQARGASGAGLPAAGADSTPVSVDALPVDIRKVFPHLKVGGGMYSPQRSSRLVVLNDQVWREGEVVEPGLVVLEIKPALVVLSFRQRLVAVKF